MRWIPSALLLAGFPTWMWYWISDHHVLVYMYAMMGYAVLMVFSACWAGDCLPQWRSRGQRTP